MKKTIALFDVDGTLTKPRNRVEPDVLGFLEELHGYIDIGIVGGSDLHKIQEQLGDVLKYPYVDYVFSENGLVAHAGGSLVNRMSIASFLGEERLQDLVNYCLGYLSETRLPVKRGTFIEYRAGMLNISPIGRSCSQKERDDFEEYDKENGVRKKMIDALEARFTGLRYSIGGQISFDVFPEGWDKTYCLRFLGDYDEVYFFGDKTMPGGNDYEIYSSPQVKGHSVTCPGDTVGQCRQLFMAGKPPLR